MVYWILWGIDAVVAAGFVVFFVIGLADGSVSSFNIALWMATLTILAALLGGTHTLRTLGRVRLAKMLLALLAVPSVLVGALFLAMIVFPPDWK